MAHIILITGGSRSGKSDFAQQKGESLAGPRLFVATSPHMDDADEEMSRRIRQHRQNRDPEKWCTCEEPLHLARQLVRWHEMRTVLVDCITMWINNLMYEYEKSSKSIDEKLVIKKAAKLIQCCRQRTGTVLLVTNEVGLGIVPENRISRLYRDLVGRCNQCLGKEADEAYLVSCGIAHRIK